MKNVRLENSRARYSCVSDAQRYFFDLCANNTLLVRQDSPILWADVLVDTVGFSRCPPDVNYTKNFAFESFGFFQKAKACKLRVLTTELKDFADIWRNKRAVLERELEICLGFDNPYRDGGIIIPLPPLPEISKELLYFVLNLVMPWVTDVGVVTKDPSADGLLLDVSRSFCEHKPELLSCGDFPTLRLSREITPRTKLIVTGN